ncbi:MAG TPA: hypothetical protein VGJ92_10265, partial [Methanocella sp.]
MPGKQYLLLSAIVVVLILLMGAMLLTSRNANNGNDAAIDVETYVSADGGTTWQDADNMTGPCLASGTAPQFKFVVSNTGKVNLSKVDVTDDVFGNIWHDGTLATGASHEAVLTGTWAAGQHTNRATATGSDRSVTVKDNDTANYFGSVPGIGIDVVTNGADRQDILVDASITWTYTVSNTGNTPLDDVTVDDNRRSAADDPAYVSGDTNGDGLLDSAENWIFKAYGVAGVGAYNNTGTVTGRTPSDAGGNVPDVTDSDDSSYFGIGPKISIAMVTNNEDGPTIIAGDPVTRTYTVKNTGNVPLSSVTVTDNTGIIPVNRWGDANLNGKLDPEETWVYTVTGIAQAGVQNNVGTASGSYGGKTYTASDPSSYFGAGPALSIVKHVNGEDSNTAPGVLILIGQPVSWAYVVINTGNVPLTDIAVTDDPGVGISLPKMTLAPGESMTCTASATALAGQYANSGTAAGTYNGRRVSNSDIAYYYGYNTASIDIVTATNGGDDTYIPIGAAVAWTYQVTNTGNVTLTNIIVTDNRGTTVTLPKTTLAPAESMTGTAAGTATVGLYENIGTVTATRPDGSVASASDASSYFGSNPGINIVMTTNGADGLQIPAGHAITWRYTVTNTGNVPLREVAVRDNRSIPIAYVSGDTNADGSLNLTETWIYEATGTATAGSYANTGTVTAMPPVGALFTDEDTSSYVGYALAIDVEKSVSVDGGATWQDADTATGPYLFSGTNPQFRFTVMNTGEVPLTGVTLTDTVFGAIGIPGTLTAGAVCHDTRTGTWAAGQHTSTATATGSYTDATLGAVTVTDSDAANYYGASLAIDLETYVSVDNGTNWHDADALLAQPYLVNNTSSRLGFVVTNTGNVPLANIVITDTVYGTVGTIGTLAAGASAHVNVTGVWKEGQNTSSATASVSFTDGAGTVRTATDTDDMYFFGADPKISIVKSVNGQDANNAPGLTITAGAAVTWTYLVTNEGNVPLTAIAVTDDQGVTVTMPKTTLAIGESMTGTASGTAVTGLYVNIGTVTGYYQTAIVEDSDPAYYTG